MRDAGVNKITVRIRTQSVEFRGANLEELEGAARAFAEYSGFDIFNETSVESEGVTYLMVTYTNPDIPWLSPGEPQMITFRSGEQN